MTLRSVPLPVTGLIDLSAIMECIEAYMVNVRVDAKMQRMLMSMSVSRPQELTVLRPGMVDITFCWDTYR